MTKVRINTKELTEFGKLTLGEYFFHDNDLYLKVNENTAYCFNDGEFIGFYDDSDVEWVDDDKITVTIGN